MFPQGQGIRQTQNYKGLHKNIHKVYKCKHVQTAQDSTMTTGTDNGHRPSAAPTSTQFCLKVNLVTIVQRVLYN